VVWNNKHATPEKYIGAVRWTIDENIHSWASMSISWDAHVRA
jgi:hypothetical protein